MMAIQQFWNVEAQRLSETAVSTHRDFNQSLLEIDVLMERVKQISPRQNLLVVGCGNGYTASQLEPYCKHVVTMDYARNFAQSPYLRTHAVACVEQLPYNSETFDVAISKRCLINLPSWHSQQQAIREVHRVLQQNGTFLMLEATEQGYARLNCMRETVGLSPIKVAWHNKPLDTVKLTRECSRLFHIKQHAILDLYYFISRIIHPLLVQPDEPQYDAEINVVARLLEEKLSLPCVCSPLVLFEMVKKRET